MAFINEKLSACLTQIETIYREMRFDRHDVAPANVTPVVETEEAEEAVGLMYHYATEVGALQVLFLDGRDPDVGNPGEMVELPVDNWMSIFDTHPDSEMPRQVKLFHDAMLELGFTVNNVVSLDVDQMAESNPDFARLRPMPVVTLINDNGLLALINASPVHTE